MELAGLEPATSWVRFTRELLLGTALCLVLLRVRIPAPHALLSVAACCRLLLPRRFHGRDT